MDDRERLEAIRKVLDDLDVLSEDHVILIEGINDRKALTSLGVSGVMFQIQSEGGPIKAAEYVAKVGSKAVILTDWDRKGGILANDLIRNLSALGLKYDTSIRAKLSVLCKKYAKDVESLDSVVYRLESETEGIY